MQRECCHAGQVERTSPQSPGQQPADSALARELAAVDLDPAITDDERAESDESSQRDAALVRDVPPHHGGH